MNNIIEYQSICYIKNIEAFIRKGEKQGGIYKPTIINELSFMITIKLNRVGNLIECFVDFYRFIIDYLSLLLYYLSLHFINISYYYKTLCLF